MAQAHVNGVTNGSSPASAAPRGRCPINHKAAADQEDFEHDFTTAGKPGQLGCPFAKMTQNGLHTPSSQLDPIALEFHADKASVASPSNGPVGVCPIRFLDKHSPEEIAQFFENHKHEIPRSHEVCVRRYQRNEQGARLLDAKYGNLVNMIQGLGNKHKQYLPDADRYSVRKDGYSAQNETMQRWTEDVSQSGIKSHPPPDSNNDANGDDEERTGRFERPLREVRVGESPSRPWGIPVPLDQEIPPSAKVSEAGQVPPHQYSHTEKRRQKPVARKPADETQNAPLAATTTAAAAADSTATRPPPSAGQPPPQIIFSGPVFIGYSPEDAAKFLRSLNLATTASTNPTVPDTTDTKGEDAG
ncbi:hypothetical protein DV736_g710, partial [Chaetothyriales sp. CBS 134916]